MATEVEPRKPRVWGPFVTMRYAEETETEDELDCTNMNQNCQKESSSNEEGSYDDPDLVKHDRSMLHNEIQPRYVQYHGVSSSDDDETQPLIPKVTDRSNSPGIRIEAVTFTSDDEQIPDISGFFDDYVVEPEKPSESLLKMQSLLKRQVARYMKTKIEQDNQEAEKKGLKPPPLKINEQILDYYQEHDPDYYAIIQKRLTSSSENGLDQTGYRWDETQIYSAKIGGDHEDPNNHPFYSDYHQFTNHDLLSDDYTKKRRKFALEEFSRILLEETEQDNKCLKIYSNRPNGKDSLAMTLVQEYGYNLPRVGKLARHTGDYQTAKILRLAWRRAKELAGISR